MENSFNAQILRAHFLTNSLKINAKLISLVLVFCLSISNNFAQISSTFDTDNEGWSVIGNAPGNGAANFNANGNPTGCVMRTDIGFGQNLMFVAPAKFLGNKSWAYGGQIRFQLRQSVTGGTFGEDDLALEGGGLRIVFDFAYTGSTTWTELSAPLTEAGWRFNDRNNRLITQAEMLTVLCNLTAIKVRGEYTSTAFDDDYLDNFIIDATRCLSIFSQNLTICRGQSVVVNGRTYTTAGSYRDSISRCFPLCDSIILTNLTVADPNSRTQNVTICTGQNLRITTRTYTQTGTYRDTLRTFQNCDSIIITNLTVSPPLSISQNLTICSGQNVRITTRTYTQTGVYRDTLRTALGCDSIIVTNLTVAPPITNPQNVAICPTQSFTVGNRTYTTAGTYRDTFRTALGCDSIVITNLTIQAAFSRSQNVQICQGQTFTIGARTYTLTGSYRDTFRTVSGCDSIVITNLTVNPTFSRSQILTLCTGQNVRVGTKIYTQTGVYRDTLRSITNCDSIVSTNLTVSPPLSNSQNISICQGQNFRIGTRTYTTAGTYRDTLRTPLGCDSIVITNLTVNPNKSRNQNIALCTGGTYSIGSKIHTTTGVYRDTLRTFLGCDSIVITNLMVNPAVSRSQNVSLCFGRVYVIGSKTYTQTGIYRDTFRSFLGCDSIVTTNLTVDAQLVTNISATICQGKSYQLGNITHTRTGNYSFGFQSFKGCDSIVNLNLTVTRAIEFVQAPNICAGEAFRVGFKFYNVSATYRDTLKTLGGCDSIVVTDLLVREPIVTNQTFRICEGDSLRVGNRFLKTAGTFRDVFRSIFGCDSTVNTTITLTQITGSVITENAVCIPNGKATVSATLNVPIGDFTFRWSNGQTEVQATGLAAGNYTVTATAAGCSKVFTATIGQTPSDFSMDSIAQSPMCYGFSDGKIELRLFGGKRPFKFLWNDGTTDSLKSGLKIGTYRVTVTDAKGCRDSVVATLTQPDSIRFDVQFKTVTCPERNDGTITLSNVRGGVPRYEYSINGDRPQNTLIFNKLFATPYRIQVRDSTGCTVEKEIELVVPPALTIVAGRDTTLKLGDSLHINPVFNLNPFLPLTYAWRPPQYLSCTNCPNPTTKLLTQNTRVALTVKDSRGCEASDSFFIEIKKNYGVYFPTAFSPNNDGKNDFFTVFTNQTVKSVKRILIFNRWGDLVFTKNNINPNIESEGWDGMFSGNLAPEGVYAFFAEVAFLDDVVDIYRGEINLIR